jgi:hypothetical protein
MPLTVKALYTSTKNLYRLSFVAGKNGLDHRVSWVYYTEDASTIEFIRGGELTITTGMNIMRNATNTGSDISTYTGTYLSTLIQTLKKLDAAGLIINTGRYVKDIPQQILDLCDTLEFPLFTMPWEIHMVDLMEDFGNRIVTEKKESTTVTQSFYNLLFQPEKFRREDLHQTRFENSERFGIITAELPETETNRLTRYFDSVFLSKPEFSGTGYCWFMHEKQIIFVVVENPEQTARLIYQSCSADRYFTEMRLGISNTCTEIELLPDEYRHALLALKFSDRGHPVVSYRDLGVYRLLGEITDKTVLQNLYDDILGKANMLEKDKRDDYLKTLRLYLESGCKVQQTAETNSLHRNTVNYRIRKMRDILGCDFQNGKQNFLLLMALYIKTLIEKK